MQPWLARVGKFSVELGPQGHNLGGAEDIDWVLRALALGAQLHYAPDMVQFHYVDGARLKTGYVVRKAFARSSSTARGSGSGSDTPVATPDGPTTTPGSGSSRGSGKRPHGSGGSGSSGGSATSGSGSGSSDGPVVKPPPDPDPDLIPLKPSDSAATP